MTREQFIGQSAAGRPPGTRRVWLAALGVGGFFHGWTKDHRGRLLAVVELTDGEVKSVPPADACMVFVDFGVVA